MIKHLVFISILFSLVLASISFAASSVVETSTSYIGSRQTGAYAITLVWTDDDNASGGGSFDDYTLTKFSGGKVVGGTVDPGAVAPTALYDINILDRNNVSLFGTKMTNLSETVTTAHKPIMDSDNTTGDRWVFGNITLDIDGQAVDSANGTVVLYIEKPYGRQH